ncbi:MAG: hypothetical protein KJZ81_00170 [Burkholderiaceae bacterium]|nr:hypothetical protein [Burkholderiaceae bacterium]
MDLIRVLHMHTEVAHQRGSSMPHTLVAAQPPAIVMTRVWMHEHDWLHSVYASHANQSPTFRFPDLLSACIELVLSSTESLARLQLFLGTELGARDPKAPRRSCHVWRRQFDELLREHRAAWNSHPNPKFELDAIATGCVAVVRAEHDPVRRVLTQARLNCAARAAADADQRG